VKKFILTWLLAAGTVLIILGQIPAVSAKLNVDDPIAYFPLLARSNQPVSFSLNLEPVSEVTFSSPVEITHAGDGSDRLFIVEQAGRIWIMDQGIRLAEPFLDITERVYYQGERGLLGLTFHPRYRENGLFYIDYTRAGDGATVIARYRVSARNPDLAIPDSGENLLIIPQPFPNHNGGKLAFSPDGYLIIAMGDGGGAGDPNNNAQDTTNLLGKLLRIDVDSGDPYGIPADNPFAESGGRPEIWVFGLRNPWRFSFDRLTQDVYIADVGQNAWEEVNFQPADSYGGINYGWRCFEGTHVYNSQPPCNDPVYRSALVPPVFEYSHTYGHSITGGYVYRGSSYPLMYGHYLFGDFTSGMIWSLYRSPNGAFLPAEVHLDTEYMISTFGEDETGELYLADYAGGRIYRLVATSPEN
jgi:glucose/arabinose dehydrogenase